MKYYLFAFLLALTVGCKKKTVVSIPEPPIVDACTCPVFSYDMAVEYGAGLNFTDDKTEQQ